MWMFYFLLLVFGIIANLPIFKDYNSLMLYISNVIQLVSLPLLGVGTALVGKGTEKRDQETHDAVMSEIGSIKNNQEEIREVQNTNKELLEELKNALVAINEDRQYDKSENQSLQEILTKIDRLLTDDQTE
jgi:hypothetical protein